MLNRSQEKRVWEGMLGSEIRSKYFAELSGRYMRRQRFAIGLTLFFTVLDVVALFAALPAGLAWLRPALAICATGTSVYLALSQNERNALDSAKLHGRWTQLQQGYQSIWENVDALDAPDRLNALDERTIDASNAGIPLLHDRRAMLKWQDHTEREYHVHAVI